MKLARLFSILAVGALAASAVPSAAQSAAAPAGAAEVYARMQKVNAGLHSYTATMHVDVVTHGFPYISPQLDGTAYYKQPDKNAVVFNTVPALASAFKHIEFQLEPPSVWPQVYEVTPVADDGTTAAFKLVRKKRGRIDHVDVKVDDKTATVTSMTYYYNDNGGSVSLQQQFDQINGNYVVKAQTGKVDIPHYNADLSTTFTNYKLNVHVADSVFQG